MQIEAGPTGPQHSDGFERSSFLGSPWTHIHILAGALGPGAKRLVSINQRIGSTEWIRN